MNLENKTAATSAMPSGIPGWPDLDFSMASALKKRMALAMAASCFSPELIFLSLLSFAAAAVTEPRKGCYLL